MPGKTSRSVLLEFRRPSRSDQAERPRNTAWTYPRPPRLWHPAPVCNSNRVELPGAWTTLPDLTLPYIVAAQAQKHVTHNEAVRALDALVQLMVLDKDLASPPGSPADGNRYIVAASPTGAWAGQAGKIAAWQDGAWAFLTPREGWLAWVADEDKVYAHSGTAWAELTASPAAARRSGHQCHRRHHQPPRRQKHGQPLRQRRQRPPAEDQQGGRRRYGEHALPDRLLRPRRVRSRRRRQFSRQGQCGRLDLEGSARHRSLDGSRAPSPQLPDRCPARAASRW